MRFTVFRRTAFVMPKVPVALTFFTKSVDISILVW